MVISYRRFGATYRSHLQGSRIKKKLFFFLMDSLALNTGLIGCPETSIRNDHYSLRNNPEEHSSRSLHGRSLSHALWSLIYQKLYPIHIWEEEDQLDATQCFTELIICSTCFGNVYAHHQELATVLLVCHVACNSWLLVVGMSGTEQQAMRQG